MARRIDIAALVDRHNLRPVYQPVVDLDSGEVVGAEALARWPELDIMPDQAFRWALREGQLSDLDEACRDAAIDTALEHGLPAGFRLFVNLEPSTLVRSTTARLIESTRQRIDLVVEITERELLTRPAELVRAVHQLRSIGCAIALDDVGAVPDSLALLPLVSPDVVKLDLSLIQRWPDIRQAAIIAAVAAYSEQTGATILAEGIENDTHLEQAVALGATLGQGWHFSRPGDLGELRTPNRALRFPDPKPPTPPTPFSGVDPGTVRVGPKGLLLGISRHLESQGLSLDTPPVVFGAFQEARNFTPDTALRYARLADRCPLVGAVGVGLSTEPVPGVRGVSLAEDDPFRGEWAVAVIGAHFTGALIAKDLGDQGPDRHRRFAFVLTHDPDTVLAAARSILERVEPSDDPLPPVPPAVHRMIRPVRAAVETPASVSR
jgi:EAL domain-containing protein (putative c-di-GMP-specific phosphodiesterase class I)